MRARTTIAIAASGVFATIILIVIVAQVRQWLVGHDAAFFQSHPDDLRRVLNDCRAGGGWAAECEEAEAVATY